MTSGRPWTRQRTQAVQGAATPAGGRRLPISALPEAAPTASGPGLTARSAGSWATCSRHHDETSRRRPAPTRGTPATAPSGAPRPRRGRHVRVRRRRPTNTGHISFSTTPLSIPRGSGTGAAPAAGRAARCRAPARRGGRRRPRGLARGGVAAAGVGPHAGEGRLGQRPPGDEQRCPRRRARSRRRPGAAGSPRGARRACRPRRPRCPSSSSSTTCSTPVVTPLTPASASSLTAARNSHGAASAAGTSRRRRAGAAAWPRAGRG